MPKLNTKDIISYQQNDPEFVYSTLERIKIEQDTTVAGIIAVLGFVNIEFLYGFLFCYYLISEAIRKQSIAELEGMIK